MKDTDEVRRTLPLAGLALALSFWGLIGSSSFAQAVDQSHQWHQFRGPLATGEAPHSKPPTTWSETENIKWKVPVPGVGSSTPIIWGDRLFLLTAIKTDRVDSSKPAPEE